LINTALSDGRRPYRRSIAPPDPDGTFADIEPGRNGYSLFSAWVAHEVRPVSFPSGNSASRAPRSTAGIAGGAGDIVEASAGKEMPMPRRRGKVALISGSGAGIGRRVTVS